MNDDYLILVDEKGQPYIAHANGEHRYIQKLLVNGKNRYFYTREQIEAYLARLRGRRLIRHQQKQNNNWQSNRPTSHKKNVTGVAKESWFKKRQYD